MLGFPSLHNKLHAPLADDIVVRIQEVEHFQNPQGRFQDPLFLLFGRLPLVSCRHVFFYLVFQLIRCAFARYLVQFLVVDVLVYVVADRLLFLCWCLSWLEDLELFEKDLFDEFLY